MYCFVAVMIIRRVQSHSKNSFTVDSQLFDEPAAKSAPMYLYVVRIRINL